MNIGYPRSRVEPAIKTPTMPPRASLSLRIWLAHTWVRIPNTTHIPHGTLHCPKDKLLWESQATERISVFKPRLNCSWRWAVGHTHF